MDSKQYLMRKILGFIASLLGVVLIQAQAADQSMDIVKAAEAALKYLEEHKDPNTYYVSSILRKNDSGEDSYEISISSTQAEHIQFGEGVQASRKAITKPLPSLNILEAAVVAQKHLIDQGLSEKYSIHGLSLITNDEDGKSIYEAYFETEKDVRHTSGPNYQQWVKRVIVVSMDGKAEIQDRVSSITQNVQ